MLGDLLGGDLEDPVAFVSAHHVWGVLENYLGFLAGQDGPTGGRAPEETSVRGLLVIQFLPLVFIGYGRRVHHIEPFAVLDLGAQRLKLDDIILGLEIGLLLSVFAGRQFKVADGPFRLPIQLDDKFFGLRIEVLNRDDQQPRISIIHLRWREL